MRTPAPEIRTCSRRNGDTATVRSRSRSYAAEHVLGRASAAQRRHERHVFFELALGLAYDLGRAGEGLGPGFCQHTRQCRDERMRPFAVDRVEARTDLRPLFTSGSLELGLELTPSTPRADTCWGRG